MPHLLFRSALRGTLAVVVVGLGNLHGPVQAQDAPSTAKADDGTAATAEKNPAADAALAKFQQELTAWKDLLSQIREVQVQFKVTKPADRPAVEVRFNELVNQGEAMAPGLVTAAEAAYQAAPNKDPEVSGFLLGRTDSDLRGDLYEECARLATLLSDNDFPNPKTLDMAGISYFALGDYDAAEKYLKAAKEKNAISRDGQVYLDSLSEYRELWNKEKTLRDAEAKANDLPRVLLKTNKGDMVLELFENEAPNTVANFVSLVGKGFYNGLAFHRVIRGFMAQGGDPKGNGSGGPGYNIACECYEENHRSHFRGSLSMAKLERRDTGGSQFFLTFRPTPHLNGKHTVFGRVIEGMDVLAKLQHTTEGREPDKIIEAKVLRKRKHDYKPNTLPEQ